MAIEISNETIHDVIVEVTGHVKGVYVRGFIGGWEKNKEFDFSYCFYWDRDFSEKYEEIKRLLLGLLEGDSND